MPSCYNPPYVRSSFWVDGCLLVFSQATLQMPLFTDLSHTHFQELQYIL